VTTPQVDYFAPASTPEEAVLRRIKGEFRRSFIAEAIRTDGLASIPPQWIEHDLQELFKQMLAGSGPRRRGRSSSPRRFNLGGHRNTRRPSGVSRD
jgi:hypothetical protein